MIAWARRASVVILSLASHACAAHLPPASKPFDRSLTLNTHRMKLHFANGESKRKSPLIVYTTGDGGWVRKDLALYRQLVSWGYPIAGFSAPEYLDHLRGTEGTTTPGRLGRDYAQIIAFAETTLHVPPGTPVVLVGVSRGAGLEVVAAGHPSVHDKLRGVVAIALTKEEEYVRWFGRRLPLIRRPQTRVMVEVYDYLPLLGNLPVAVVQSTRDQFLPAAAAVQLFGADTPTRRFRAIDARNHSFAGAREQMYEACKEAFDWIVAGGS
jgi:fermentation-respiration switch protein FrsA (DUF1100 family)